MGLGEFCFTYFPIVSCSDILRFLRHRENTTATKRVKKTTEA